MKSWLRGFVMFVGIAVLVVACSNSTVETTTTSTVREPETTTTVPATTTTEDPGPCPSAFCVTYHIRPEAIWSDGTPVTSADFVFTREVFADPLNGDFVHAGYDTIETVEVVDEKTVIFGLAEVYGPWRTLFDIVLPAHIADPANLSVTASAFRLDGRVEADRIVLKRNTNYWSPIDLTSGASVGDIEGVEFVFVESVRDRLAGLEAGVFDLINPHPVDWIVADLAELPDVTTLVSPGPFWEHIDFNHDDPLLSQLWVRQSIAMGINRDHILDATVRTIEYTPGLANSIWMTNAAAYETHYEAADFPEAAEQVLIDHSCVKGEDGIYVCDGQRMSFRWVTTVGEEFRETTAEMARESLSEIGIELVVDLRTPSDLFSADVFFAGPEVWQIINFSWKAAADPHLGNSTYYCAGQAPSGFGALNVNRYCNEEVEALIRSTNEIVDAAERSVAYNMADRLYLDDIAIIPLYQKPSLLAWRSSLSGPTPNMSRATDMWNLAAWQGQEAVVIALETEPIELDPVAPWDRDTALVMRSLVSGAFSTTPNLEFVPVLIEGAETYVRDR